MTGQFVKFIDCALAQFYRREQRIIVIRMWDMAQIDDTPLTAADGFIEANRRLAANEAQSLNEALQYIVDLATHCLKLCDWAAVTEWPKGKAPFSVASTSDIATQVDAIQYSLMQGPCLEAASHDVLVSIPDLELCRRWPEFCASVVAQLPVRSVLSYPLGHHPDHTALNLYSARRKAFVGAAFLEEAAMFANQATGLILHALTAQRAHQFADGMESNRQIGTAVGVLMALHHLTSGEAFDMLKKCSNRTKRKVRDIAIDVIETGELPI